MKIIKRTARIRERNQLTIPYLIAQSLDWIKENSFVNMQANHKEIVIKPLVIQRNKQKKKLSEKQWQEVLKNLKSIRKSGKQNVNLASFIQKDRLTH